jgi:quinol-cytochrome oxidoreductase complex cytochrome b subunit
MDSRKKVEAMADERPFGSAGAEFSAPSATETPRRHRFRDTLEDQLALRSVIHEYMIPEETNTIWYTLGGVLAIALILEILTGFLLATRYVPDAGRAYGITKSLLKEPGWSVALNFHYWNSYVIFALVMVHMMRVFISAAYRRTKKGLWEVGVALAGLVFLLSLTGETLHWTSAASRSHGTSPSSSRRSGSPGSCTMGAPIS